MNPRRIRKLVLAVTCGAALAAGCSSEPAPAHDPNAPAKANVGPVTKGENLKAPGTK